MTTAAPVSVIVVLYNGARYIERCLASLLAAEGPSPQIIVVDNGSTDDGPRRVAERFPQVELVLTGLNTGYAGGINSGLKRATSPYIAAVNADAEVEAGWLIPLISYLNAHPHIAAVTPLILIDQDRGRVNTVGGAIHPSGMSFCNRLGQPRASIPPEPFPVPGVSGACFVMRRALLEEMGGAPEFCFMGNDDVILSWTLRLMGHELACVPQSVVYHRYNLTLDAHKLYLVERNRLIHLLTALERRTLLRRGPHLVALEALIGAYCVVRGPRFVGAKLRAVRDGLGRPAFLKHRRGAMQRLRRVDDGVIFNALSPSLAWQQLFGLLGRGREREESVGG